jgi:hypothetical protein
MSLIDARDRGFEGKRLFSTVVLIEATDMMKTQER